MGVRNRKGKRKGKCKEFQHGTGGREGSGGEVNEEGQGEQEGVSTWEGGERNGDREGEGG